MEHFEGITPDNRWKNDMLSELKRLNTNIEKMMQPAQNVVVKPTTSRKPRQKRTS